MEEDLTGHTYAIEWSSNGLTHMLTLPGFSKTRAALAAGEGLVDEAFEQYFLPILEENMDYLNLPLRKYTKAAKYFTIIDQYLAGDLRVDEEISKIWVNKKAFFKSIKELFKLLHSVNISKNTVDIKRHRRLPVQEYFPNSIEETFAWISNPKVHSHERIPPVQYLLKPNILSFCPDEIRQFINRYVELGLDQAPLLLTTNFDLSLVFKGLNAYLGSRSDVRDYKNQYNINDEIFDLYVKTALTVLIANTNRLGLLFRGNTLELTDNADKIFLPKVVLEHIEHCGYAGIYCIYKGVGKLVRYSENLSDLYLKKDLILSSPEETNQAQAIEKLFNSYGLVGRYIYVGDDEIYILLTSETIGKIPQEQYRKIRQMILKAKPSYS